MDTGVLTSVASFAIDFFGDFESNHQRFGTVSLSKTKVINASFCLLMLLFSEGEASRAILDLRVRGL